jgi:hypothetical protein
MKSFFMGYDAKSAEDGIKTKELTVPHTQEFLEWLANRFFPVVMCAHKGFSCCAFAHRTPIMEISMMKQKREIELRTSTF